MTILYSMACLNVSNKKALENKCFGMCNKVFKGRHLTNESNKPYTFIDNKKIHLALGIQSGLEKVNYYPPFRLWQ